MKVLITGIDGYIGFPLSLHLLETRHEVVGIDNFLRRRMVEEVGSHSATPIRPMEKRLEVVKEIFGKEIAFHRGDMLDYDFLKRILHKYKPDSIVNLAQQPAAPYSMIDAKHAAFTQHNNVIGILNLMWAMREETPDCHVTTLGTMGEYGQPNMPIPEGFFEVEYEGMRDRLPFPRQAGSFYHWSKVHSSGNAFYCCQIWDLEATDIMQGVVHGVHTEETAQDERLITRFDFDEVFGTMINRACACLVIGHLMLPYGLGEQTRGYIALRDSIQCLTLSVENPPTEKDSVRGYRVLNQFDECYSCNEIARRVLKVGEKLGMETNITNIENPRVEKEEHFYQPEHQKLYDLGFKPIYPLEEELEITLKTLMKYKDRIEAKKDRIMPTVYWKKKEKRKISLAPRAVKTRK